MSSLNQALTDSLNTLGEHPDISICDVPDNAYEVTLTWPQRGWLRFTVDIGDGPGTFLVNVLGWEGITCPWKDKFVAHLYGNLEGVDPAAYLPPQ